MVMHMADAVQDWVSHLAVGVVHVDLGAQHLGTVVELPVAHALELVEVLFDTARPIRAVDSWHANGTARCSNRFGVLVVDVGEPLADQHLRPRIQLLEPIRCVLNIA